MLHHTQVVAVDLAFARVKAAAHGHACRADGDAAADGLTAAGVGAAVLQAFHVQIAAHLRFDGFALDHGALQRGVCAALQADGIARGDMGVGMHQVISRLIAPALAGTERNAGLRSHADTYAARAGAVFAALAGQVLRCQQEDVAFGLQGHVFACADVGAANQNVTALPRALCLQVHIATSQHRAATSAVTALRAGALAFAGAHAH